MATLREARNGLFYDARVEVAGVQLTLPAAADPAAATASLLGALDVTAPAWVRVPLVEGWEQALDVLAADGTENAAVDLAAGTAGLAAFVRRAVDLDVTFRVTGERGGSVDGAVRGPDPGTGAVACGLLNLLCAVRAALNGAETPEVEGILACTEHVPLVSAVRRMSAADAAVARAFLASVDTADVAGNAMDLRSFGLV